MQNGSFEENQDYIGFSPNTTTSNEMAQLKKRKLNDTMAVEEGEEIEFPRALQPVVQPDGPLKRFTHSAVSMPKTPSVRPPVISLRRQYMSLMVSEVPPWLRAYFTNRGVLQEYLSLPAVRQLHKEIVAFNQYISPTEKEKSERRDCVERIRSALQTVWPNAKVLPFGSYFTELYLPTSDIDIVCVVENLANVSETVLRKAAKSLLKSNIADATTIKIISKARVPLVKFTDVRTRYTVDISFNQDSGVDGSEHIKSLVNRFPALRPLLLVMKQFLVVRGLNEVYMGGLGSYALTLLIASFLRLHPMLQSKWIRQDLNLGVLLIEFMELYGKLLNYDQVGVSLLNGYFLKEKRGWLNGKKSSLLSVEDPYEQENDVTKGTFGIQTVRQALSHGYDILTSLITLLQHSTNVVESSVNPNSFLSAVLDIPEEVLEHRNFIHHL